MGTHMRRLLKWLLGLLVLVLAIAGAGLAYVFATYPAVAAAEQIQIAQTPERIARGRYLFDNVAICVDCHSTRDFTKHAGPIVAGTHGKGGEAFTPDLMDVPGAFYARNITPAALSDWTDGEILRAIAVGVNKQGEPLFPLMPYLNYRQMDRQDLEAIVAYMRTLQPIPNHVPDRSFQFPMQLIVRTIPLDAAFAPRPSADDRVAYGGYLARAASCADCHTPREQGQPRPGMTYAGGMEFRWPWGSVVRSANITPDADSGIGTWSEEQFVQKFKAFENAPAPVLSAAELRDNTVMPWRAYAGMSREDLGAIYAFLRTQTPVINRVEIHSASSVAAR